MLETTYLTVDDFKSYTPISQNCDVSQLENWIPVGEEMHIVDSILGIALDTQLKTQIENGTLSGNNQTLVDKIKDCSAWYSYFEAIGFIRTKTMNKGVVQQSSDNSTVAPLDDYKIYKQDILDKCQFYRNRLITYLEKNKALYPLWRNVGDCDGDDMRDYSGGIWV